MSASKMRSPRAMKHVDTESEDKHPPIMEDHAQKEDSYECQETDRL